jgi:hypothetical protein
MSDVIFSLTSSCDTLKTGGIFCTVFNKKINNKIGVMKKTGG